MKRPAWTITEAVERTGASRSTIRRYRESGKFPHAYKDPTGVWRFPHEDLLAAGFKFSEPAQDEHVNAVSEQTKNEPEQDKELVNRVSELERMLAVEQTRNEGLERLAQQRQENVIDLRRALRMLEVGSPSVVTDEPVNTVSEQVVNTPTEQVSTPSEQVPKERPKGRFRQLFSRS